jgi:hypothetical protein
VAKATLTLQNGTVVNIEGTTKEVRALLDFYGGGASHATSARSKQELTGRRKKVAAPKASEATGDAESPSTNLSDIIATVKNCEEADAIEHQVLDRTSQVDRTLLPLYIVHEHFDNAFGLSSGDVSKITTDLGVPVSQSNASTTLSGTASKYVIGDRVRRKGQPVKYKLSRRGVKYIRSVIRGTSGEDKS